MILVTDSVLKKSHNEYDVFRGDKEWIVERTYRLSSFVSYRAFYKFFYKIMSETYDNEIPGHKK